MSFLQPLMLLALPLIGLPIVIHLLNQRRHKTAPWAAREFVLQAANMGRGMAVVKHWLILLLRTLAIAALIFIVSRPLASRISGLGFLGTQRTQIIVLDRSPSMELRNAETGLSWRQSVLSQLQQHLTTVGAPAILIHSLAAEPVNVTSNNNLVGDNLTGDGLSEMLEAGPSDTQANIPELIERAIEYVEVQAAGPTDIWVCTDQRASDWQLESGRWNRIRQQLEELSEVQLRFLIPEPSDEFNLAVSVTNAKLIRDGDRKFVSLNFQIQQSSGQLPTQKVPVQVNVSGGQRNLEIEMSAATFEYQELLIEVPNDRTQGGGVIRLPFDSNPSDNVFYFSWSVAPPLRSVVISDDEELAELLELVCTTPSRGEEKLECTVLPVDGRNEIDWTKTGLIVWHAPLPTDAVADQMQQYVDRGGDVIFLPTEDVDPEQSLFGIAWGSWKTADSAADNDSRVNAQDTGEPNTGEPNNSELFKVAQWQTENDLLATDESGQMLPFGSLTCSKRCSIKSDSAMTLATFSDGEPVLVRATTPAGGVYFLATTPDEQTSSFTENGIVLYVMLHRALQQGSQSLASSQQLDTGSNPSTVSVDEQNPAKSTEQWKPLDFNADDVPSDQLAYFAGVYETGKQIVAFNRPISEDAPKVIDTRAVEELLGEDSFEIIATPADSQSGLSNEVWRLFVIMLVVALIVEGWLSLPPRKTARSPEVVL